MWYSNKCQTEEEAEAAYFMSWRGKLETAFYKQGEIRRKIGGFAWNSQEKLMLAVARFSGRTLPTEIPF